MKNFKFYLLLIVTLALLLIVPACKKPSTEVPQTEVTSKIALNKTEIKLEKYEFEQLIVSVENAENQTVTWFTNNSEVATIENGTVYAVSEGMVVVGAKLDDGSTAKCFVVVTDNKLVPNLSMNIEEETNLMIGTSFNLEYSLKYNGKILEDVDFSFDVSGDKTAISLENGVITANSLGNAVLTVTAKWGEVVVYEEYSINVMTGIMGEVYNADMVELCNDDRADLPVVLQLNPVMYDNGTIVDKGSVSIESIRSDLDIISVDGDKIVAEKQGVTNVYVTLKNAETGNSVECKLTVKVSLYEQDKTETITITNLYHDDVSYKITPAKVFKDLEETDIKDEKIVSVTDVTGVSDINIAYNNDFIDVEQIVGLKLLGERIWRIETEKLSYLVKINIEEENPSSLILGDYIPEGSEYIVSLKYLNNTNVVEFYDLSTKTLVSSGSFEMRIANDSCGLISFSLDNNAVYDLQTLNGFYWEYKGCVYVNIGVGSNEYESFSLNTNAPYETISGIYSSSTWAVKVQLNQDKTFVLDVDNTTNKMTLGTYSLTATSAYGGLISVQLEKEFAGQKTINGTYDLNDGKYEVVFTDLSIFTDSITMCQNVEKITIKDDFAGYYYVKGNQCAPIMFNKDGSCFFAFPKSANNSSFIASAGYYELVPDETDSGKGTVKIYLERGYYSTHFTEGEYVIEDGVYVITAYIKGTGNGDVQKFTQRRSK
ncbi:MAG: hypothetical protein J6U92_08075 [Clostridia bacterium]|nr:hypothetical protein [Clostridia bacterium]